MPEIQIHALEASPQNVETLSRLLVETVADGASVSFMDPLAPETATTFWTQSLEAAARNERVILGAYDGELLVGTVTLLLGMPQNQQHRAEIAKLITRISYRGRGVASRLMRAAERLAIERGRTLLVLDTAEEGGASPLYERLGFTELGTIPGYALKPHGGLTGATFYWKHIGDAAR